jgi:hypothetical protein
MRVIELGQHRPASPEENRGELSDDQQDLFDKAIVGLAGNLAETKETLKGQERTVGVIEAAFSPDSDTIIHVINTRRVRELRVYIREPRGPERVVTEETFRVGQTRPHYDKLEYPEGSSEERHQAILGFDAAAFARSILNMPDDAPLNSPQEPNHTFTSELYKRATNFIDMCDAGMTGNRVDLPMDPLPFQNR